jgi:hypothetical protein
MVHKRAIRAIDAIRTVSRMAIYDAVKHEALAEGAVFRHRRTFCRTSALRCSAHCPLSKLLVLA